MKVMDIIIVGIGGLAKEILGMLISMNKIQYGINIKGFVSEKKTTDFFSGFPVLGDDEWLIEQPTQHVILAIAAPKIRYNLYQKLQHHVFPSFVHPHVDNLGGIIGDGVIIMPQVVIEMDVVIGNFVFVGSHTFIGHDAFIGNFCTITYGVGISGHSLIGDKSFIGTNAVVIDGKSIGQEVTLGAGAVVTKYVPNGETWVGVPARKMR
jgi:sugar O-acyltransferase (sialic acid O-acetyltransferase NeuD family)